jgi:hypothetical protein
MVNGKIKGSTFERTISKLFTEWWNKWELEGKFYRTPGSGALAYRQRDDVIGDLTTPAGFMFTIEVKNREDWKCEDLFFEGIECKATSNSVSGWWAQSCKEAYQAKKYPMLIIKRNFYDPLVMIPVAVRYLFDQYDDKYDIPMMFRGYNLPDKLDKFSGEVLIVRLSDFLAYVTPNETLREVK